MTKYLPTLMFVAALLLGGCSPYRLQGVVVEGVSPGIEVVDKDDERLQAVGLSQAQVTVYLDPDRFSPKTVGKGVSNTEGDFSLAIDEPGAGLLILDVEVAVTRPEYAAVRERFELPGGGKRLLVTLKRGKGGDRVEGSVLEETLKDAEPFLKD